MTDMMMFTFSLGDGLLITFHIYAMCSVEQVSGYVRYELRENL